MAQNNWYFANEQLTISLQRYLQLGNQPKVARCYFELGCLAHVQNHPQLAQHYYECSHEIAALLDDTELSVAIHKRLAQLARAEYGFDAASSHLQAAFDLAISRQDQHQIDAISQEFVQLAAEMRARGLHPIRPKLTPNAQLNQLINGLFDRPIVQGVESPTPKSFR